MIRPAGGLSLLLLVGCAVGPDYHRPGVAAPAALAPATVPVESASVVHTSASPPWERWWEVFRDPELDRLVGQALVENQDLRAAVARVQVARSLVRQAYSPLLPAVGASGQYDYQKASTRAFNFGSGVATGAPAAGGGFDASGEPFQFFSGTADMSYELDLWGRIRRGYQAARGEEAAVEEDRKAVEISLVADVAQTYFELGQFEAEMAIARETIDLRQKTLELARSRFQSGLAPELELRRSEGELAAARALLPQAEESRAVAEHRLAILVGRPPDLRFQGKPPSAFAIPPEVPVGIPSELLTRRPDIRAAERRLLAASARVGAAMADFFPRFTIAGRFGYASLSLDTLTGNAAQLWSIGPSVRIPVFQGGLLRARLFETEARQDEATAGYRQVVLQSFAEVADAIAAISSQALVRDREREAVQANERAVELAGVGYREGLTDYLGVLDSQAALLLARRSLLLAEGRLLSSLVRLEKALGGGWSVGESEARAAAD